ncbi:pectin lyase-like protein [Massarina eburnea CBS 473.64]|uniref:pectin lyase n=1 Tax=Massarina eburnea CBS 473.64 TaxID=1395130 RepID=A0A6A6S3B5_9PLEO|nr:pectin lyase-like protein [Massarina eburnea CBS 473.64]
MVASALLKLVAVVGLAQAASVAVSGTPEGFAADVTGGGSATAVYPDTTDELISYLGDDEARVIVLTKTFDFTTTEGTTTATGCAPWGTATGCQVAINQNDWCTNYQSDAPSVSVTYDNAGIEGITVGSDKTLLGEGSKGIIEGKGLRIANGAQNVIIQNIHITNLNPQYVWGGDAITLDDCDLVWIDHVTTSKIGREHIVLGTEASGRVSITNCDIDGESDYSATCDGYHYWALYFTGSADYVTFKNNYIHHISGRAPKVGGGTLLHAVNNLWADNDPDGHAFEVASGGYVLAEGNVFQDTATPQESGDDGAVYSVTSSTASDCSSYIGRDCIANTFSSSGTLEGTDSSVLTKFKSYGQNFADADSTSSVTGLSSSAGFGTI